MEPTRVLKAFKLVVFSVALVVPLSAKAQEREQDVVTTAGTTQDAVATAVADGSFSALTMPARVGSTQAFAWGLGGYDSSRKGPLIDSAVEVHLWGPLSLRGAATYSNDTDRMRPSVGARVQLLRQEAHGVDGSLSVFFKTEGFTESEGEIESFASIGRRFEKISLVGNLVYGQDPEGNERDGETRLYAFHQSGRFTLGIDTRVRFAIGAQHGKAETTEPTFDAVGGPVATAMAGPLALFAEAGPSAFRLGGVTSLGVAVFGGVGTAF
jgi:hypothetical protein